MTTTQHSKSFAVLGIENPRSISRFEHFLSIDYTISLVPDQGEAVLYHFKFACSSGNVVTARVFTTGTINLMASSQLSNVEFEETCGQIEELAKESAETINLDGNLALVRSTELLAHIGTLDVIHDNSRTIIVILADTVNEIVLRESLKRLGEAGQVLRASVPEKISKIESYGRHVYMKDSIKSLRELRNNVIHEGQLPSQLQAQTSLETATNVLHYS